MMHKMYICKFHYHSVTQVSPDTKMTLTSHDTCFTWRSSFVVWAPQDHVIRTISTKVTHKSQVLSSISVFKIIASSSNNQFYPNRGWQPCIDIIIINLMASENSSLLKNGRRTRDSYWSPRELLENVTAWTSVW